MRITGYEIKLQKGILPLTQLQLAALEEFPLASLRD
jgi:hypothetical protein